MRITDTSFARSTRPTPAAKPLPKGYPKRELPTDAAKRLHSSNLLHGLALMGCDWALVLGSAGASATALVVLPTPAGVVAVAVAQILIARGMRGFECLVHEASHSNLCRTRPRLQTRLTNLLAAHAVCSDVDAFRRSHTLHHLRFGTLEDPDWVRHREIDVAGIDRSSIASYARSLASRLVVYGRGWWTAIGTDHAVVCRFVAWHMCVLLIPGSLLFGPTLTALLWLMYWLFPMMFVLPVLRFIAETAEHDYPDRGDNDDDQPTEASVTWSNIGVLHRLLLHPHGDGFHVEHHARPTIPGWKLAAYRRQAQAHHAVGRILNRRTRTSVIEGPDVPHSAVPLANK